MSTTQDIKVVAVIGAGQMGHGIAEVFAQTGYEVRLQDVADGLVENALRKIRDNLNRLAERGIGSLGVIEEILSRITPTIDLAEAVADADFVIECVPEKLGLKQELFLALESLAPPQAILASNTSMLKISDIGRGVHDKERLVTVHWFNPPYLLPIVEVVKGPDTSDLTVDATVGLLKAAGKIPIRILKEVPGHLVNRIQFAVFREALGLLQDGVAAPEEIDKAVSGSLGIRWAVVGPLRSIDFTGLDKYLFMKDIYRYLDNSSEPQQVICDKIEAGHFGYRAGKGFYDYDQQASSGDENERDDKMIMLLRALYHGAGAPWKS